MNLSKGLAATPFLDARTGLVVRPWLDYLLGVDAESTENSDSTLLLQQIDNPRGIDSATALLSQLPAMPRFPDSAEAILSAIPSDRQWSTFAFIQDTRANRTNYPAALYASALYAETDSVSTLIYRSDGVSWKYFAGIYKDVLANLLGGLGTADTGLLYEVTNYDHILEWNGAAWIWGPGEIGSGYYQLFEAAPTSGGSLSWQICDGSTVARLNADGTTTNVTVPNVATAAYLKGGTSSAAVAGASGLTTSESAHTHAVDPPSTVSGNNSATVVVQAGVGTTVAADPHTHTTDIASFSSGAGSAHDHGPNTLELRNKQAILYYRR